MSIKNSPTNLSNTGGPGTVSSDPSERHAPLSASVVPTWKQRSDQRTPEDCPRQQRGLLHLPRASVSPRFVGRNVTVLQASSQEHGDLEHPLEVHVKHA